MLSAGKWVMAIVGGGIVLGAVLGEAVNPSLKPPPEQWWQLTGRGEAAEAQAYPTVQVENFNPFTGFRPDLDYDAEVWALPLPDYDHAAFADYDFPTFASFDEQPPAAEQLPADDTFAAHEAGGEAEAAAQDALAAEASEGPAPGDARKPDLSLPGLY